MLGSLTPSIPGDKVVFYHPNKHHQPPLKARLICRVQVLAQICSYIIGGTRADRLAGSELDLVSGAHSKNKVEWSL